jgi:hypothetical protein
VRDPDQRDPDQRDPDLGLAHPEAAGWVLGTLDRDDAEWFAGHLPQCPDCEAAVAELGPTARLLAIATSDELLAAAPPEELPPPELQAQTLAAVAQAASAAAGPDAAPAETSRTGRWRGWSARMLALAAAVVVAAGISIGLLLSGGSSAESYPLQLHSGPGQAAAGQSAAVQAATASGTMRQAASGWSVQLTAEHLPAPGPGQFYQCWWVGPGNRSGHPRLVSAGTFTVSRSGAATVQMWTAADPDDFPAVEITLDSATRPGLPGRVVLSGTVGGDS